MDRRTLGGLTKLWALYELSAAEPPSARGVDVIGCLSQATHKRPSNRARSGASRWNAMATAALVFSPSVATRIMALFDETKRERGSEEDEGVDPMSRQGDKAKQAVRCVIFRGVSGWPVRPIESQAEGPSRAPSNGHSHSCWLSGEDTETAGSLLRISTTCCCNRWGDSITVEKPLMGTNQAGPHSKCIRCKAITNIPTDRYAPEWGTV